ncbi:diguanylate cyclase domain-containing protein [Marinobacter sp. F3R11]|uniref:diguanylate cyclase domain-containing protein n=1 Tax=Marinobacter sp. F3R11 TaxID=2267231 RepID=UPI000DE807FD|nr:diguanylate cyclase [Marinobacter sp. F3R11]RBW48618.1 bifunctional diguanylate cyclase/phosphodiesterase [Marinobacter sp. F3R11]
MPGICYPRKVADTGSLGIYSTIISRIGLVVILISVLVVLAWIFDVQMGKRVLPALETMKINTALCFLACGFLFWRHPHLERSPAGVATTVSLALFLLVVSGLTLLEYGAGWRLGIDNFVIPDTETLPENSPGRMSAGTAICFSLLSIAWLAKVTSLRHATTVLQLLALAVIVISGAALIGYIFGVRQFRLPVFSTMAVHTAALFVLCGTGMLLVRPGAGVVRTVASSFVGGRSMRRLLPVIIVTPVLMGWLSMQGVVAGYYAEAFGFALSSLSSILVLVFVGWLGASALNREEERFLSTMDSSPVATLMVDANGTIQMANQFAHSMFLCPEGQLVGSQIEHLMPARFRESYMDFRREYLSGPEQRLMGDSEDLFALRRDGTEFRAEIALNPVQTAEGHYVVAAILDITERVEAELKIRRLNRIHKVLSGINTLIVRAQTLDALYEEVTWITVEEGGLPAALVVEHDRSSGLLRILHAHANDKQFQMRQLSGYEIDAVHECLQTHNVVTRDNLAEEHDNPDLTDLIDHGIQAMASFPLTARGKTTDAALVLYQREPFSFDHVEMKLLYEIADDISFAIANLENNQQLEYLTHFDKVTDLPNRLLLADRLQQAMFQADRQQGLVSILYADIDRFKQINGRLGHAGGDAVLWHVAQRINSCIGKADTVSRWGGDEFIVLLPGQGMAYAAEVADRIVSALQSAIVLEDGQELVVSCGIGIAEYPRDGQELDHIINTARKASRKIC